MKKLTPQQATSLLIDIVKKGLRHRDYERVTAMADKLTRLITGEDMGPLMRRFDRRESEDQFKQRKDITQHITGTVSQNLMKPAYKIPRSNGARRVLMYDNDKENNKINELNNVLSRVWGTRSLDDYLSERWIELTYTDPNSFVVFEWDNFDNKRHRAEPYPFEVSSHEAIYYQFANNILQYLVVMNEFEKGAGGMIEKTSDNKNAIKRYTIYFPGYSVVFDELDKEAADKVKPLPVDDMYDVEAITSGSVEYINISNKIYRVWVYNSNLDFIPAFRVGFRSDIMTRGRTCVSPINEAVPILMKTVKANSELDLAMSLHAHPQRVQYLQECTEPDCNKGRLPDGSECLACGGTGMKKTPTTAQESIDLRMPRDPEDIVTLDNIVRYITPSVDLIRFQDEYIRNLTAQCKEAIYNSEIFSRQQIAETATGKNIDLQNVYDSLYNMAMAFSWAWGFGIKAVTEITDMGDGLHYSYIFNKDFKMKSLNDLYNDLKLVADSKAPAFIKQGIYDDIARIIYTDDEYGYMKYKTKEEFYPYTGKTQEEIMSVVTSSPPDEFNRVLWEIYGWIYTELERKYKEVGKNFYDQSRRVQWDEISKIVERERAKRDKTPKIVD